LTRECSHLGMLIPLYGLAAHSTLFHGHNTCHWEIDAFTDQHFIHSVTHHCTLIVTSWLSNPHWVRSQSVAQRHHQTLIIRKYRQRWHWHHRWRSSAGDWRLTYSLSHTRT